MHGAYNVKVISLLQSNSLKNVTAAVKIKKKSVICPSKKMCYSLFDYQLSI
jgi:hypothetical protein